MKTLVHRIGSLGDQVAALPALWAFRDHFPQARLSHLGSSPWGRAVFEGSGLFEDFLTYDPSSGPASLAPLTLRLRFKKFDNVLYLAPSLRTTQQIKRDLVFFRLAGIPKILGSEGFFPLPVKALDEPLPRVPHEADLLLRRLAASGIPVPASGQGRMDLGFGKDERDSFEHFVSGLAFDGRKPWIAVAPGTNQPANRWPLERYQRTLQRLVEEEDLWPIVVGGPQDREAGDELLRGTGRGFNWAGLLTARRSALALSHCRLYLGNDTGPLHLAAAVGTPCVGVFSSRNPPGKWEPYGKGHKVLRTSVDCEGCGLSECLDRKMECILAIDEDQVLESCRKILAARTLSAGRN